MDTCFSVEKSSLSIPSDVTYIFSVHFAILSKASCVGKVLSLAELSGFSAEGFFAYSYVPAHVHMAIFSGFITFNSTSLDDVDEP